jgi:hypothetical protein
MCRFYGSSRLLSLSTRNVSPAIGNSGRQVTLTGTGFVEIPHADAVLIESGDGLRVLASVWAACTSHTSCTAVLPKLGPGTYRLEMTVAGFSACSSCQRSARFQVGA